MQYPGHSRAGAVQSACVPRMRQPARRRVPAILAAGLLAALPALPAVIVLAALLPAVPASAAQPGARGGRAAALAAGGGRTLAAGVLAAFRGLQDLSPRALEAALVAIEQARSRGIAGRTGLLTLIDYSLPSTAPRLWVLDLAHGRVLFHELVAHGAGSGDNYATRFSNQDESRQSSLGLFLTGDTYEGGNGYSLKLHGLEPGINDQAEARRIVMHGAWYVSAEHARLYGRLGRSWGCPALPQASAPGVIDAIKSGSFLFAYAGDPAAQRRTS
jgi:hypothetical protein